MFLDKEKKPLGLKITQFVVGNIFWYLVFSLIYWNMDPKTWWLTQSIWGRLLIVLIEFTIFNSSFQKEKDGKS